MICARIVARLQHLVTSRAYVAWRSLYIRQVRARRLMARLRHRSAALAFGRWAAAAVTARTTAVLRRGDAERAAFHHDLRAAQDVISRRAVRWATQRWRRRSVARGMAGWTAWAMRKRSVRALVKRSLQRVHSGRAATILLAWARRAGDSRRLATLAARVAGRVRRVAAWALFKRWEFWVRALREAGQSMGHVQTEQELSLTAEYATERERAERELSLSVAADEVGDASRAAIMDAVREYTQTAHGLAGTDPVMENVRARMEGSPLPRRAAPSPRLRSARPAAVARPLEPAAAHPLGRPSPGHGVSRRAIARPLVHARTVKAAGVFERIDAPPAHRPGAA